MSFLSTMIRIFVSALFSMLVPIGFWIGGWEFQRGDIAVFCYGLTLLAFGVVYSYPGWSDHENRRF